jgi:hypothetical protein
MDLYSFCKEQYEIMSWCIEVETLNFLDDPKRLLSQAKKCSTTSSHQCPLSFECTDVET